MKLFSGFPAGKMTVTPLPNVFFSELLPAIDDLAELKVTLHALWLLANHKEAYVCIDELRADRTLMQALISEDVLQHGLDLATERGTLLKSGDDTYFLNSEKGRRAFEKFPSLETSRGAAREPANVTERPNIFALYEKNIGMLTPMIAEELKEAEAQYPPEWIEEAIKIAAENNKRSWSYARKILERWQTEGRGQKSKKSWHDKYDKFVKR
jgi:DNA replication protein